MGMHSLSSAGESGASTETTSGSPAARTTTSAVVDPSPDTDVEAESLPAQPTSVVLMLPPPRTTTSVSRYKGVVPQPNGRWGAQIYERHARVWLGTFPDEASAARAYDVAALRFRGRDAATNSPSAAGPSAAELDFLAAHSKAEIVDMLRKHTYNDELRQSLRRRHGGVARSPPVPMWAREGLFEKAVTPSDVGKLNRLVVPKQHAEKHFPLKHVPQSASGGKGVLLNFEDGDGKVWRFRYSYWNSSQSYVLTKGWSRFVREKGLKAGDTVAFSRSAYGPEKQLFIECKKKLDVSDVKAGTAVRAVKLFGVDIAATGGGGGGGGGRGHGGVKRGRDVELVLAPLKRQRVALGADS